VAALQAIMKIEPRARVVMVSALGQPDMVARTLQAGAADYITKPLVPDMAAQIILRALNKTTESI
jgi:two-component system chemotaxis response regulator CheY